MNSGNDAIYKTNMRGQQRTMVKLVDSHIYSTLLRRAQLLLNLPKVLLQNEAYVADPVTTPMAAGFFRIVFTEN